MSNSQHGSDEEEDYMSEAFLNSLVSASESQKTKKHNLTYSERRRQKEREHLANLPKPLKEREREAREKGLETEIGEENKGMAMLLKMGFKKGGTLGASKQEEKSPSTTEQSPSTTTEQSPSHTSSLRFDALRAPLAIQMKQGRGGLGMDTLNKQKEQEEIEQSLKRAHEAFDVDYRGSKRDQFDHDKRSRQLGAAQAICMQLDVKEAAKDALEGKDAEEGASEPELEDREPRRMGRSNSFWWIADSTPDDLVGTRMMGRAAPATTTAKGRRNFDLSDDEDGDPEDRKEKRVRLSTPDPIYEETVEEEEEPEAQWGEKPAYAEMSVYEKLEKVVQYLRQEHSYCFWCSAQYYGQKDLEENCPGEFEDDH